MAHTTDGKAPEPGPEAGIDELQADIDRTRRELGDTVSALAVKADVKARAKDKADSVKDAAVEWVHAVQATARRNPAADVGVLVAVAAAVGAAIWIRRRRNR